MPRAGRSSRIVVAAGVVAWLVAAVGAPALVAAAELPPPMSDSDFRPFDERRAALGRLLFYDKILSGNRNISCGTCHHHDLAGSDGLSLGVGEGGVGLGPERVIPTGVDQPNKRVPRNANALFNLGHRDVRVLFHDGRVSDDDVYGTGFNTPAEEWLPPGLQSVLAAQALFPVTSPVEMAGTPEENDIGAVRNKRIDRVWPVLVARLTAIPDYVDRFRAAWPDIASAEDISIVHVGNAIDDFINSEWRSFTSPFDAYLAGDATALDPQAEKGLRLFYGKAGCAGCHAGPLLTDQDFHALALPPFGPGRVRAFDPRVRDVGRMSESDRIEDAYRFRTPSLRNVAETGPWGHNGAYGTLDGMVRHHLDPLAALDRWDRRQLVLPRNASFAATDFAVWEDRFEMARFRRAVDITPVELTDAEVDALVAFLTSLSDDKALAGRLGRPESVPSGLSVD